MTFVNIIDLFFKTCVFFLNKSLNFIKLYRRFVFQSMSCFENKYIDFIGALTPLLDFMDYRIVAFRKTTYVLIRFDLLAFSLLELNLV